MAPIYTVFFYADDLVLISHSAKGLQKALSILEKYCNVRQSKENESCNLPKEM